ncbi:MAG: uracil-DNA glycosylase [Gemmatimonadetes bacterium]|nr:uracil-DNA glycosylase [Gemmatimonadota bacterium]
MPAKSPAPPGFPAEIPSPATLEELHAAMLECTRCDLYQSRTQVVPGAGNPEADLILVGEAPGAYEDKLGVPFVGASGKLLDAMLTAAGIDRDEVFIANVVRSRPPGNRAPKPRELRACAGWLAEQIRIIAPRLVVTLGRFALQHFIPAGKITQLQGTAHEVQYGPRTLTLLPLLHPSAILRNPDLRGGYEQQFVELGRMMGNRD